MKVDCSKCVYACLSFDEFYNKCKPQVEKMLKTLNMSLDDFKKMIEENMNAYKKKYRVVVLCTKTLSLRVANPEIATQSFECKYFTQK